MKALLRAFAVTIFVALFILILMHVCMAIYEWQWFWMSDWSPETRGMFLYLSLACAPLLAALDYDIRREER